jgi:hypothetical protein
LVCPGAIVVPNGTDDDGHARLNLLELLHNIAAFSDR